MTVAQNVAYGLRVRSVRQGRARRARASEALDVGAARGLRRRASRPSCPAGSGSASRWPGRSSTGRGCCCSTSRSARSTSSCARRCRSSSRRIQREVGITFVFVTHDQDEALTMSDRIAVFNDGRHRAGRRAGGGLRAPGDRVRRRLRRHRPTCSSGDGRPHAVSAPSGTCRVRPERIASRPSDGAPARAGHASREVTCRRVALAARRRRRLDGVRRRRPERPPTDAARRSRRGSRVRLAWPRARTRRRLTTAPSEGGVR